MYIRHFNKNNQEGNYSSQHYNYVLDIIHNSNYINSFKHSNYINSLIPHINYTNTHFIDKKTEKHKGWVTWLKSQNKLSAELKFELWQFGTSLYSQVLYSSIQKELSNYFLNIYLPSPPCIR